MSDNQTNVQPTERKNTKFRFKKDKLGNQRPSIEVMIDVPTVDGIVEILEKGGKGLQLLLDCAYDVVRGAVASDVAAEENYSQDVYNSAKAVIDGKEYFKYSWDAIANQPRAERSKIDDETWAAFATDYVEIMPGITGKSKEAVELATTVYLKKFSQVKTNKEILNKLQQQLALYTEHTKRAEEFQEILDLLSSRLDTYLKSDDVAMLAANL